ncbi:MAG: hypothetical protein AAF927_16735 [Bacteroidota bacterium]
MCRALKIPVLILALVIMGGINLIFLQPKPDLPERLPDLSVNAHNIYRDFCEDEAYARQTYLDKTIEVSGILRSVERTGDGRLSLILGFESRSGQLRCELDQKDQPDLDQLKIGEAITLKGFGRDYLFEVVMDHTIVVGH